MSMYAQPMGAYPMPMNPVVMQPAPMMGPGLNPMMGNVFQHFNMNMPIFLTDESPDSPPPKPAPVVVKMAASTGSAPKPAPVKKASCSVCGAKDCPATKAVTHPSEDHSRLWLHRRDAQTPWGLELTSDTDYTFTVTALTNEARARRWDGDYMLKIGDVITGVVNEAGDVDRTKEGMVKMLKTHCAVQCDFARVSNFTATLTRKTSKDPLQMDVQKAKDAEHLTIVEVLNTAPSCVTKYNEDNAERPLVAGDRIVAVNGETEQAAMVTELQTSLELNLSVQR